MMRVFSAVIASVAQGAVPVLGEVSPTQHGATVGCHEIVQLRTHVHPIVTIPRRTPFVASGFGLERAPRHGAGSSGPGGPEGSLSHCDLRWLPSSRLIRMSCEVSCSAHSVVESSHGSPPLLFADPVLFAAPGCTTDEAIDTPCDRLYLELSLTNHHAGASPCRVRLETRLLGEPVAEARGRDAAGLPWVFMSPLSADGDGQPGGSGVDASVAIDVQVDACDARPEGDAVHPWHRIDKLGPDPDPRTW
jgi:hypothetical protein